MLGKTKARRINSILRAYVYVYDPSITGVIGRLALMTGIVVFYDLRRKPESGAKVTNLHTHLREESRLR